MWSSIEYNHSRLIRINTTPEQLSVYKQIFGVSRKMYNDGIVELRNKKAELSNVRDIITNKSDKLQYCKNVPLKIRQGALEDLIKASNNCIKKWKKTKKFQKCKFRSKHDTSQSIYMNHDAIKKIDDYSFSFYKNAISKYFNDKKNIIFKTSEKLPSINTHCRLILKHNKYLYISIPLEMPIYDRKSNIGGMVALDPGVRNFQTFYSPHLNGQIGNCTRNRYLKIFNESDLIKSKLTKMKKKLKKLRGIDKVHLKKIIKNLKKKFLSVITKPSRITKEIHNKTALFLCKNFDTVVIPEYSSKETSKNLNETVNRSNQALSHFSFRQRLIHKVKQFKRTLHIVPESYTSMTCTKCGNLNNSNKHEYLECNKCNLKIHRDLQGSRNIFIKTIEILKNRSASGSMNA